MNAHDVHPVMIGLIVPPDSCEQIEHTIQWSRDQFEGWFKNAASEVNSYLTDASYLGELAKNPNMQLESLQTIKSMLVDQRPLTFDQCIAWARLKFEDEYNHKIRQLLINFPADQLVCDYMEIYVC